MCNGEELAVVEADRWVLLMKGEVVAECRVAPVE
jgi:hypothetical protein